MIDDVLVLRVERLRDSVEEFRAALRARYRSKGSVVSHRGLKETAGQLGERWLVEVAHREDVIAAIGSEKVADLNIEFQRLITLAEHNSRRDRYDAALRAILENFRSEVVVPLKQGRFRALQQPALNAVHQTDVSRGGPVVFLGQSFLIADKPLNEAIRRLLTAIGFVVLTGEKPKADTVSHKVRERIDQATIFVGVFTRRDRLKTRNQWTTSAWVIDEKAYALATRKRLILLKEAGVQSIGGIQGDYEYLEFTREELPDLLIRLLETALPLTAG